MEHGHLQSIYLLKMVDFSIVILVYQKVNLHFPMGFPMFSHFPMVFQVFSPCFMPPLRPKKRCQGRLLRLPHVDQAQAIVEGRRKQHCLGDFYTIPNVGKTMDIFDIMDIGYFWHDIYIYIYIYILQYIIVYYIILYNIV